MSTGKTKARNGDFLKTESGGRFAIYLLDNIPGDPLLYHPIILLLNQSWIADFFWYRNRAVSLVSLASHPSEQRQIIIHDYAEVVDCIFRAFILMNIGISPSEP